MERPAVTLRGEDAEHVLQPLQADLDEHEGQELVERRGGTAGGLRAQVWGKVEINKFQNAKYLPHYIEFTPKQIRERFLNYLRPSIKKDDFQFAEDLEICKFVLAHGKHWRKMEEVLPGRPEGCIKGRYYGKLQKIIESALSEAI